ncbi:protein trichome birefringence-like 42 [Asparagus officinalis]|uniref:protein trichome birefringence-like 42 n=1 Tax=Asparagus officinalis TaxID=4686 RepID=UPI00098E1A8E|nr:protein trichome birefringence-like 42 [Asparagus officinalis]
MEYAIINPRWSLCIFASFFGFVFLFLNHDQGQTLISNIVPSLTSLGFANNHNISITEYYGELNIMSSPQNSSPHQNSSSPQNISSSQLNTTIDKVFAREKMEASLKLNSSVSEILGMSIEEEQEECDVFDGMWVYDPKDYPLYHGHQCPFLSGQVVCQKNGRPDSDYEHWRWKPRGCDIPRFNGTDMLERLRGKRVAIIGDSLNRNQWESMACLLYSSINQPSRTFIKLTDTYKIFRALDYDFSLEFFWSPFMIKADQMKNGSKVLKLDELVEPWKWQDAEVLVFNTGHWWTHHGRGKTWDYYEHDGKLVEEMDGDSAFEAGLNTWANWIDRMVNPNKTRVFFRSISPQHTRYNLHWCYNQSHPITNEVYRQSFKQSMISIVEKTIKKMKTPVKYLNITRLSEYRREAHTSIYTVRHQKLLTDEERKQPEIFADCNHWCLPGLPDTWNSLLYTFIVGSPSVIL